MSGPDKNCAFLQSYRKSKITYLRTDVKVMEPRQIPLEKELKMGCVFQITKYSCTVVYFARFIAFSSVNLSKKPNFYACLQCLSMKSKSIARSRDNLISNELPVLVLKSCNHDLFAGPV